MAGIPPRGRTLSATDAPCDLPLMAAVNDEIDRLHSSLDLPDSEFFCECGHIGCAKRVKLSRDEFAALRAESGLLIVAGHNGAASATHELARER